MQQHVSLIIVIAVVAVMALVLPARAQEKSDGNDADQKPENITAFYDFSFLEGRQEEYIALSPWWDKSVNPRNSPQESLLRYGVLEVIRDWVLAEDDASIDAGNANHPEDAASVWITGRRELHQRVGAFRGALRDSLSNAHEVSLTFLTPTDEQARHLKTAPQWVRILPDAEAASLIASSRTARSLVGVVPENARSFVQSVTMRRYLSDYDVDVAQGVAEGNPIVRTFPAGTRARVWVSRLASGGGTVLDFRARHGAVDERWPTFRTPWGKVELPRERAVVIGSRIVLKDGQAAVLGAPDSTSSLDGEPLPALLVVQVQRRIQAKARPAASRDALLRFSPLVVEPFSPSWAPNLELGSWYDPGPISGPPEDDPSSAATRFNRELEAMRALLPEDDQILVTGLGDGFALAVNKVLPPGKFAEWAARREAPLARQYAASAWLLAGNLNSVMPEKFDPRTGRLTAAQLGQALAEAAKNKEKGIEFLSQMGTICPAGRRAGMALLDTRAFVGNYEVEVAQAAHGYDPVISLARSGTGLDLWIRPIDGKRMIVDLHFQHTVIESMDTTDIGKDEMQIQIPVQRLIESENRAVLDDGTAMVLRCGEWERDSGRQPLSLILCVRELK